MRLLASLLVLASTTASAAPTIGTAHPVRLLDASPDGRWAAICEARADTNKDGAIAVGPGFNGIYGDQMAAFLVTGTGPGIELDDFVDRDPTGRWVVILRKAKLVLLDTTTNRDVDLTALGAYTNPARDPSGAYLGVSFTATHLAYVAVRNKKVLVAVRDLVAGTEVTIDPGPGKLWSVAFAPSGARVLVEVLPIHADPKVAIKFPSYRQPGLYRDPRCITRTYSDDITISGDNPVMRIAATSGGTALDVPGYITTIGDATVRRDPKGAIFLDDAKGVHELLPAVCTGVVKRVDPIKGRLLARCKAKGDASPLLLVSVGSVKDLGVPSGNSTDDYDAPFGRHVLSSTNDADDTITDLDTGKRRVAKFNQRDHASLGDRTLVSRHLRLIMLDGPGETDLGAITTEYPEVLSAGTIRYIAPLVVDMATGKLLGVAPTREMPMMKDSKFKTTVSPSILAVAADGRMLGTYTLNVSGYPDGPLEWITPVAPPKPTK
jgi:hypothetical protein